MINKIFRVTLTTKSVLFSEFQNAESIRTANHKTKMQQGGSKIILYDMDKKLSKLVKTPLNGRLSIN